MSENCTHDCGTCGSNCSERTGANPFLAPMNDQSNVRHVIGVVSGKGGVGKSLITSLLATAVSRKGNSAAILDADITGPSIPRAFGIKGMLKGTDTGRIVPAETKEGIKVVSLNLLLQNEEEPVIWRGPVIAGVVQQFWSEVEWGMLDVLLIDMPPGTGDVPLTVFQSVPVDGLVLVTTPQDLVSMIVTKALNMARKMDVKILGLVENMSYIKCPHCDEIISLFGSGDPVKTVSEKTGCAILDKLPLDADATAKVDSGRAEEVGEEILDNTVKAVMES